MKRGIWITLAALRRLRGDHPGAPAGRLGRARRAVSPPSAAPASRARSGAAAARGSPCNASHVGDLDLGTHARGACSPAQLAAHVTLSARQRARGGADVEVGPGRSAHGAQPHRRSAARSDAHAGTAAGAARPGAPGSGARWSSSTASLNQLQGRIEVRDLEDRDGTRTPLGSYVVRFPGGEGRTDRPDRATWRARLSRRGHAAPHAPGRLRGRRDWSRPSPVPRAELTNNLRFLGSPDASRPAAVLAVRDVLGPERRHFAKRAAAAGNTAPARTGSGPSARAQLDVACELRPVALHLLRPGTPRDRRPRGGWSCSRSPSACRPRR